MLKLIHNRPLQLQVRNCIFQRSSTKNKLYTENYSASSKSGLEQFLHDRLCIPCSFHEGGHLYNFPCLKSSMIHSRNCLTMWCHMCWDWIFKIQIWLDKCARSLCGRVISDGLNVQYWIQASEAFARIGITCYYFKQIHNELLCSKGVNIFMSWGLGWSVLQNWHRFGLLMISLIIMNSCK